MLRSYSDSDFELLEKWVTDAELLLQFSGTDFIFPITQKQLQEYSRMKPDRHFYIGIFETEPFAFGEIIPQANNVPRLGRILVGEASLRGKGLGRYFIKLLLEKCRELFNCQSAELFVWDKNKAAIRCYQSAGFILNPDKELVIRYNDRIFDLYKMVYNYQSDTVSSFLL